MCRFAFYLGAEISIGSLVTDPTNSIIHQSYHSQEREGPLNGDGFGVAWYVPAVSERPALFRSVTPAWNNQNLVNVARVTRSPCILAHVRAATPGSAVSELNCHPFTWGPLAFMHNGHVGGFRQIRRRLLGRLSDDAFGLIGGSTDTEHVFALFVDHYRALREGGPAERLRQALTRTIVDVEEVRTAGGIEEASLLNLVVSDGCAAAISRFTSGDPAGANSLYVFSGGRYVCEEGECRMLAAPGEGQAVIVASEPLSEDPGWVRVEPNHLVIVSENLTVETCPLP